MLILPDNGFQPSINKHNNNLGILVDWIEGSIAFIDEELSQTDIIDALCENGIYRHQDFASERVTDAWEELTRRGKTVLEGSPFKINGRRIEGCYSWRDYPSYSFCLLLSLKAWYPGWSKTLGGDYNEQGNLFERLTVECLKELGWSVLHIGWSPTSALKIESVIEKVSSHLGEPHIPSELDRWISENANDEGLDVVCSDPFYDGWGGNPLFFFQCASGANWKEKLKTPDPEIWRKIISFTTTPKRGFCLPFALLEKEFEQCAGRVDGMFIDRFRLQAPAVDGDVRWISKKLSRDIVKWMQSRVKSLPDDRY